MYSLLLGLGWGCVGFVVAWSILWGLAVFYNVVVRCLVVFMKVLCVLLMCLGLYSCICGVCKGDKMRGGWREF